MIGIRNGELTVFRNFVIDHSLPKHVKDTPSTTVDSEDEDAKDGSFIMSNDAHLYTSDMTMPFADDPKPKKRGPLAKLIHRIFSKPKFKPMQTMKIVFQNAEQLKVFESRKETVEKLIRDARKNGQVALAEDLIKKQRVHHYEDALVTLGYKRFIPEKMLIDLAEKSDKAFRLDWLKNFMRVIPDRVAERKRELDKSLIFDNYAVLHYDPDGKGNKPTEAELAARRDPILFGVIQGSRKLYLIADWVDELCGLTFEELIKELQEKNLLPKQYDAIELEDRK